MVVAFHGRHSQVARLEMGMTDLEQQITAAAHRCCTLAKTQAEHAKRWRELVRLIELERRG
jgi:alpha-glucuronidase